MIYDRSNMREQMSIPAPRFNSPFKNHSQYSLVLILNLMFKTEYFTVNCRQTTQD